MIDLDIDRNGGSDTLWFKYLGLLTEVEASTTHRTTTVTERVPVTGKDEDVPDISSSLLTPTEWPERSFWIKYFSYALRNPDTSEDPT